MRKSKKNFLLVRYKWLKIYLRRTTRMKLLREWKWHPMLQPAIKHVPISICRCSVDETLRCLPVYDDKVLKGTFIVSVPHSNRQSVRSYHSSQKDALMQKLECTVTFFTKLQVGPWSDTNRNRPLLTKATSNKWRFNQSSKAINNIGSSSSGRMTKNCSTGSIEVALDNHKKYIVQTAPSDYGGNGISHQQRLGSVLQCGLVKMG